MPTGQEHAGNLEENQQESNRPLSPLLVFLTVLHLVQPHKKVGEEVVKNKIDILITAGKNSKYIAEVAKKGIGKENVYYLENKEDIEDLLKRIVKFGDVILFKASNGMKFYKIAEEVIDLWKK